MPRRVRVYIAATAAVALATLVGWVVAYPPTPDWPWLGGVAMAAVCVVLERRAAQMPQGNAVSTATIPHLAGVFLLPPPMALAAAAIGITVDLVRLREPWFRVLFNVANTAVTVGFTSLVAVVLNARGLDLVDGGLDDVGRFFVVTFTYYLVNSALLAGVMALSQRRAYHLVFWEAARASAPAEVAVSVIGGLAVFIWLTNAAWLPVVFFPMLIAQLTLDYLAALDKKARELEHQAFHDPLTQLPNRTALHRSLERALGGPTSTPTALLVMDLDGFKDVNDSFGHQYGDALLREVSERLSGCIRERGEIARLGGDEFAILLTGAPSLKYESVAAEILAILRTPLRADNVDLFVGASIGIATGGGHAEDAQTLLRRADVAMYKAKEARAGFAVYSPDMEHDRERLPLLHDFNLALIDGALTLAYQPKVSATNGELHSVEALVRWNRKEHGPVSPTVFVPLAEQAGLSSSLTRWVLDAALAQSQQWQAHGLEVPVCINLSMYDLHDDALANLILEALTVRSVKPTLLTVEVTESAAMADPERTRKTLARLRTMGVRVAVDDFGTGYSSLAYLVGLPVDELKIDRSFVTGMSSSPQHASIVRSTISMGHDLDLKIVAEGVEDEITWNRLRSFGCDLIQGYIVSRPVPGAELLNWYKARDGRAHTRSVSSATHVLAGASQH